DVASGACVAPVASACAPCSTNADCVDPSGAFTGTCVERAFFGRGTFERVCVAACDASMMCPAGFTCDTSGAAPICVPSPIGVPCTNFRAGTTQRACASDADCAPLGAQASDVQYVGACNTTTMQCMQPCSMAGDPCFVGGTSCAGTDALFFCRPP
ncbi:MAG: hypothetical protein K8H88_08065, partial [Sandaracinaceae bacterium]|nr:hypothetical protein [Sandaracinaceae bacterium]